MPHSFFDKRRSGSSRRQNVNRPRKTTILIVCEGRETEPNYFHRLRQEECVKKRFRITVIRGKGGSRQQVARLAAESKDDANDGYNEVWCVMDVEHPEDLDAMREALALLERNHIKPALSNPAFEVWFLAHFAKTGRGFLHGDAVVAQLNKHWKQTFSVDYDKADGQIYRRLVNLLDQAMANAKWVREEHHSGKAVIEGNSSTDVDLLVGKLLGK
jgi:hypothetical protein